MQAQHDSAEQPQRARKLPARILTSACASRFWKSEMLVERRSRLSSAGILLSHFVAQQGQFFAGLALRRLLHGGAGVRAAGGRWSCARPAGKRRQTPPARPPRKPRWRSEMSTCALSGTALHLRPPCAIRTTRDASGSPRSPSRSANFGRMPVARNMPRTLPLSSMPVRSKTKMSCMADDFAFHAGDLGDGDHFAGAVGEARNLDHGMNGGGDLVAHGPLGNIQVGHGDTCSRHGPARRAASWRAPWSASPRGRCSWPATCRRLLRRAPRPPRCGRDAYAGC